MAVSGASGRARLWTALFAPGFAWFAFQQGLGAVVRTACGRAGPPYGPAAGIAALAVCLGAAAWAASAARTESQAPGAGTRRFLAWVTLGLAGVFALAIAYQTAAVLLVPPCAR